MDNLSFLDIITILSFVIGVENLELNTQQVESLDKHLKEQDVVLKEEQNVMLDKAIKQNEEIISLLKELKECIQELLKMRILNN